MARQSRAAPPPFLLTRPAEQSARFAADLRARFGTDLRIVLSPLLVPEFLAPALPDGVAGVIFTSETGVAGLARLRPAAGVPAFCVGDRTAAAARAAGHPARSAAGDADALVAAILADPPAGLLLHARGEDSRGDVAGRLVSAGLRVAEAVVYAQRPQPLSDAARDLVAGSAPVVVPLFSPRSARLLAAQAADVPSAASFWVAALSPAVAEAAVALRPARLEVARRPDAGALLDAAAALIAAPAAP